MGKVSFSVSARTAKLIGQENFATAEGAIVELVKNSYDADARNCIIIFKNHDNSQSDPILYLIDNGIGMTSKVIEDQWMKIGTDNKLQNYQSEIGRVKTGAKGIGRFALDRLGLYSEMHTVSKKPKEGSIWSVLWSDFDKVGIAISDVEAELNNSNSLDLKTELYDNFESFSKIKELLDMIDLSSGTILKINPLKDSWDEKSLKSLFDNLEVLIPPQEQPTFKVHLFSTNLPDEFGLVNSAYFDDFDYKVSAKYLANKSKLIEFEITRNELNVETLESSYSEIFKYDSMKEHPFTLEAFKSKTFIFTKTIDELPGFKKVDAELIEQIGEFTFTFYFLKNTLSDDRKDGNLKKYPYLNISSANRKSWLKKFGGVKIFRDDFRVRPYGENGQDWLSLGDRQAKSPGGPGQKLGGYRIGPNQIAGTVKISRITNANFQDKSGREGIQENDAFELFRNLLVEIISFFERDRNIIMHTLSELAKQKFKDEEERRKALEEAEKILREQEEQDRNKVTENSGAPTGSNSNSESSGESTEKEKLFARATKIFELEIEEKDEEIRLLRGLASVGLIISSFAHELKGLRSRLIPRTDFLVNELRKYINNEDIKLVHQEDNPFYMIHLIKEEDLKLKHWLDYSLSTLKRDKRRRTNINIGEYFEKFEATWNRALVQRRAKINLQGTKDGTNVVRGFEVDLDTIFNNLVSNSLSAFKEKKGNYERLININWIASENFLNISFTDNGIGLAQEYKNEPNRIFEFNESSKRDSKGNIIGTGMGLYLVKLVVDDYNGAKVSIDNVDNGFSLNVVFPLRKANE